MAPVACEALCKRCHLRSAPVLSSPASAWTRFSGRGRWAPSTWPRRWPLGPSWSPDGGKIVFVRRSAGQNDVYTVNADGTDPSEVSGTLLDEGGTPDWGTHPLTP